MNKKPRHAIVIGRFQPLHIGHEYLIRSAYDHAHNVTVLVGSSGQAPDIKNPWTYEQRAEMIRRAIPGVHIRPIYDFYNDLEWIEQVQSIIRELEENGDEVIIVGHEKDDSTWYVRVFPHNKFIEAGYHSVYNSKCMDATKVRELIFENELTFVAGVVGQTTLELIGSWTSTEAFANLKRDYDYIKQYKKSWAAAPYAPTFVTADAVVIQSGHVLLVQRGGHPGFGQYALPGGFINPRERILDAAVRELMEETNIKVPEKILRKSIVATHVFDAPDRSLRGRTITHAYLFKLDDELPLPRVKGADDAAKAWWFPISQLKEMRDKMFEDHYAIVTHMVSRLDDR